MSCEAKKTKVSRDGITYYTVPGSTGSINYEGEEIEDTVFGQCFASTQTGLIGWSVSANAYYKGFAGYQANLLKAGTPIEVTAGATTDLTGGVYQITDDGKRVMAIASGYTVKDGATDVTNEIASNGLDMFSGTITFKSTFTASGTITVDYFYVTLTAIGNAKGFDLTQSSDVQESTTLSAAQGNDGHRLFISGLKQASSSVSDLYNVSNGYFDLIKTRDAFIVKLAPYNTNENESYSMGLFKMTSSELSGDVGVIETEDTNLMLYVPTDEYLEAPFKWYHPALSTIPEAIKIVIEAWENNTEYFVKYQPEGDAVGKTSYDGKFVVSDGSMSTDIDSMNEFSIELQGTDSLVANVIS